jgi:hypothetical protein
MVGLIMIIAIPILAVLALSAVAVSFGVDSREGFTDDRRRYRRSVSTPTPVRPFRSVPARGAQAAGLGRIFMRPAGRPR